MSTTSTNTTQAIGEAVNAVMQARVAATAHLARAIVFAGDYTTEMSSDEVEAWASRVVAELSEARDAARRLREMFHNQQAHNTFAAANSDLVEFGGEAYHCWHLATAWSVRGVIATALNMLVPELESVQKTLGITESARLFACDLVSDGSGDIGTWTACHIEWIRAAVLANPSAILRVLHPEVIPLGELGQRCEVELVRVRQLLANFESTQKHAKRTDVNGRHNKLSRETIQRAKAAKAIAIITDLASDDTGMTLSDLMHRVGTNWNTWNRSRYFKEARAYWDSVKAMRDERLRAWHISES